jgi:hypothetical protein
LFLIKNGKELKMRGLHERLCKKAKPAQKVIKSIFSLLLAALMLISSGIPVLADTVSSDVLNDTSSSASETGSGENESPVSEKPATEPHDGDPPVSSAPQRAPLASGNVEWRMTSVTRQSPGGSGFSYYPSDSNDYYHAPSPYIDIEAFLGEGGTVSVITLTGPSGTITFTDKGSAEANRAFLDERQIPLHPTNTDTNADYIAATTGISVDDVYYAIRYMHNSRYYSQRASINGETAYCVEPGVPSSNGETVSSIDSTLTLTRKQEQVIGLIIYYADQMGAATDDVMYTVAQYMIWEIINNALNYDDLSHNGVFMSIYNGGIKGRYETQYEALKHKYYQHTKLFGWRCKCRWKKA